MDVFQTLKATRRDPEERNDAIDSRQVKTRCICRDGAKPDENGITYFCPSCQCNGHGLRSPYLRHNGSFGGFDEVIEEGGERKQPRRQRCKLPTLGRDEQLSQLHHAAALIAAQLAARVSA